MASNAPVRVTATVGGLALPVLSPRVLGTRQRRFQPISEGVWNMRYWAHTVSLHWRQAITGLALPVLSPRVLGTRQRRFQPISEAITNLALPVLSPRVLGTWQRRFQPISECVLEHEILGSYNEFYTEDKLSPTWRYRSYRSPSLVPGSRGSSQLVKMFGT
ncbi:hypothetical protein J6590_099099 [Homalodisca vitripennis]|nr:hypothetical protein J6590_032390 [Homalodisca vitripennis]KAG8328912.1 hypothetical protein J6590_099099 [Homalodisca vitripennis]